MNNKIKLFISVFLVFGLIAFGAFQLSKAFADQENGDNSSASSNNGNSNSNSGLNGIGSIVRNLAQSQGQEGESQTESQSQQGSDNQFGQNGNSFSISNSGMVSVNGASLVSVSGNSFTAKVFGLTLNFITTSSTSLMWQVSSASSTVVSITDMKVGDSINVKGQIDSSSGLVNATQVMDQSLNQQNISSIQQQIQNLLNQLNQLRNQLNLQTGTGR